MAIKRGARKNRKGRQAPSKNFSKMVKKVMVKAAEHKYLQTNVTALSAVTGAGLTSALAVKSLDQDLIGGIAQGTTAATRIGERIRLSSLRIRGVLVPTSSTIGAVRLIVGQVTAVQTQSAPTLTFGEVLAQISGAADYSCITSTYTHEPLVKYKILSDELHTWDAQNTAAPRVIDRLYTRFPIKTRNYEPSGNVYTGMFFYMFMSANGVAVDLKYPAAHLKWTDL